MTANVILYSNFAPIAKKNFPKENAIMLETPLSVNYFILLTDKVIQHKL